MLHSAIICLLSDFLSTLGLQGAGHTCFSGGPLPHGLTLLLLQIVKIEHPGEY